MVKRVFLHVGRMHQSKATLLSCCVVGVSSFSTSGFALHEVRPRTHHEPDGSYSREAGTLRKGTSSSTRGWLRGPKSLSMRLLRSKALGVRLRTISLGFRWLRWGLNRNLIGIFQAPSTVKLARSLSSIGLVATKRLLA